MLLRATVGTASETSGSNSHDLALVWEGEESGKLVRQGALEVIHHPPHHPLRVVPSSEALTSDARDEVRWDEMGERGDERVWVSDIMRWAVEEN
jgi:hypothetical protein